eukprot:m.150788 g.150788  ORF g.150788 m.150788 type:complete len:120 (-) comp11687_c0_seq4:1082-1441(-)
METCMAVGVGGSGLSPDDDIPPLPRDGELMLMDDGMEEDHPEDLPSVADDVFGRAPAHCTLASPTLSPTTTSPTVLPITTSHTRPQLTLFERTVGPGNFAHIYSSHRWKYISYRVVVQM